MSPTSIRLTPAQEVALADLAARLTAQRPDLASAARGGTLTPGRALVLALDRGIEELRVDLGGRPRKGMTALLRAAVEAAMGHPAELAFVDLSRRGTHYRLVVWINHEAQTWGLAWPAVGWSAGDLGLRAFDGPGLAAWLQDHGLGEGDAETIGPVAVRVIATFLAPIEDRRALIAELGADGVVLTGDGF